MSRATKRKHVIKEVHLDEIKPPAEGQQLVQVTAGRGNNLHLVTPASGDAFLASMPPKFRRNVWIKRGDYVLVEPIHEGNKVKAEIVMIVTQEHEKYYKELGIWPKEFSSNGKEGTDCSKSDDDLFLNTNHQFREEISDDSESSDEDDDSDYSDSINESESHSEIKSNVHSRS